MQQRCKPRYGLLWEGCQCAVSCFGAVCLCTPKQLCHTQMGQMFRLVDPQTLRVVGKGSLDNESQM